jgi:hypothetical protein
VARPNRPRITGATVAAGTLGTRAKRSVTRSRPGRRNDALHSHRPTCSPGQRRADRRVRRARRGYHATGVVPPMRATLIRVGADTTPDGGGWNAPVDSRTGAFAYVPIPEKRPVRPGAGRVCAFSSCRSNGTEPASIISSAPPNSNGRHCARAAGGVWSTRALLPVWRAP